RRADSDGVDGAAGDSAEPLSATCQAIRAAIPQENRRRPMSTETISPDLRTILRRLKLGRMLDTLPERLAVARSQKMAPQDFLLLVLGDEASRRDSLAATLRAPRRPL